MTTLKTLSNLLSETGIFDDPGSLFETRLSPSVSSSFSYKYDDNGIVIKGNLPGVGKDNISIKIKNDIVEIATGAEDNKTKEKFHIQGSKYNAKNAAADYTDGVLTINIPYADDEFCAVDVAIK